MATAYFKRNILHIIQSLSMVFLLITKVISILHNKNESVLNPHNKQIMVLVAGLFMQITYFLVWEMRAWAYVVY